MPIDISDRFVAQCSPVISSNYDTCGTVTKASIDYLTPADLNDIFTPGGKFADLSAWFKYQIEMKACGVRRYGFYDWIMANSDRTRARNSLSVIKAIKGNSLLQPFIKAKQETIINLDHWKVTDGHAKSGYTAGVTGPLTAGDLALGAASDRVIRVETRHNIPMDAGWFVSRDNVHIFNLDGAGNFKHGQWKVLASEAENASPPTYVDVLVTSVNAGSTDPFDSAPTSGYLVPGINNVNDFEKWCYNRPTIDPRKMVPFWFQTRRRSRCVDSEYKAVFASLMQSNPAFEVFGDLPLAERNRQDEAIDQKRFVNAFLFNKPISANQTLALWESLEDINSVTPSGLDLNTGGKLQAKRANFIGVREQLRTCDRVFSLAGNKLNLYEFLDLNYNIKRARESQGRTVTDIDWFTNSIFAANFQTAYLQYVVNEWGNALRINQPASGTNELGMTFTSYTFKRPAGININIVVDVAFDDIYDENDAIGQPSAGNYLLCLDIGKPGPKGGTIYWAQIAANRKVYQTASVEQLARIDATYRCVLENPSDEVSLISDTGTAIVECPLNSAWIENIAQEIPLTTGKSTPYTNIY